MTRASGAGGHPGEAQADFEEAVRRVLGLLGDGPDGAGLPYLPEVPGRGVGAEMTGRALAVQTGLDADLQPSGWRLTGGSGAPGIDQRRARSLLGQDLDHLEERAQGYAGPFKTQVCGPWTLAATAERPRGERVLADHGARRDLAQSLADGVAEHVRELRRRVPGADRIVVQLDEPALPAVLGAQVPTASGFGRLRAVDRREASEALGWVLDAVRSEGAEAWVHSCAPEAPWSLLRGAGADGLLMDVAMLDATGLDQVAEAYEGGAVLGLGVVDAAGVARGEAVPGERRVAEAASAWLEQVGLAPGDGLVLTAGCGLAGWTHAQAAEGLRALHDAARRLDDA